MCGRVVRCAPWLCIQPAGFSRDLIIHRSDRLHHNKQKALAGPYARTCMRCPLRLGEDRLGMEMHIVFRKRASGGVTEGAERLRAEFWSAGSKVLIDLQVTADVEALCRAVTPLRRPHLRSVASPLRPSPHFTLFLALLIIILLRQPFRALHR